MASSFKRIVKFKRNILDSHKNVFYLSIVILSLFCLWPIWRFRFTPMQDYPQHLFISYVVATFNNPAYDWNQHYLVNLKFAPYSLFYLIQWFFYLFFNIETSGKLFFSIYIILIALLAIRTAKLCISDFTPWGLLLLFPFSFNQMYFFGFTNYVISIPLLFLALLDLERFVSSPLSVWSVLRQFLFQLLLLLCHPYTVLLYLVFAYISSLFSLYDSVKLKKSLVAPIFLTLMFLLWYITSSSTIELFHQTEYQVAKGLPLKGICVFYILMFTGMCWTNGLNFATSLIWLSVAGLFLFNGVKHKKEFVVPWKMVSFLFLTLFGLVVLPYQISYYKYFNLRIAPISYFFLSIIFARIKFNKVTAYVLFGLITFMILQSANLQGKISKETEEIIPVISKMEKNNCVLPLMFDSSSNEIDPIFFYQQHMYDVSYYHIVIGGGANPLLFSNAMLPVQYRPSIYLPLPYYLNDVNWITNQPYYRYILARGAPLDFIQYMSMYSDFVEQSGKWVLFQRR